VTPDELRAEAAWLKRCSWDCTWPIVNALDLSEFARNIIDHPPDDLSVGELRRIEELIKRLKPLVTSPEQLAREAKTEKRRKKRRLARFGRPTPLDQDPSPLDLESILKPLDWTEEKLRRWQSAGTRARTKNSKRNAIISHWKKLSRPLHERASAVANKLDVTAHYVRKVIREAKLVQ
jgi:hypothetical protein